MNIQGINDIIDPFYRYKMQKLNVIKQKNKTVIDNFDKVAKDLERDPKMIYNYFKKKLSVAMIFKDGILSTTADLDYSIFEKVLRQFIEEYVLCKSCKLPELEFVCDNSKINVNCKSCSHKYVLKK